MLPSSSALPGCWTKSDRMAAAAAGDGSLFPDACSIVQISMCACALQVSLMKICATVHNVPSFHHVWHQHTRGDLAHSIPAVFCAP